MHVISRVAIARLYHNVASAVSPCVDVIRLCSTMLLRQLLSCYHALPWKRMAAILDLTLRISRCDVTDLAARPPENKDVILHQ